MKIGIVGLGLIGGSYARALYPYGYDIYGIDINQASLDYAKKEGFIRKGFTNPKDILNQLDVVFVCLYPSQIKSFFKQYIMDFKDGAVISDVGGVKRSVINAYDIYKRQELDFVAAHPIAGKEKSGVQASDSSIFNDANFVITITKDNQQESINLITVLARQMGFKKISIMSDKDHDQAISYTSQLTHVLAMALINAGRDDIHTKELIGDSFRDLTRIANINETLWSELFMNNQHFLLESIKNFEESLAEMKDAIENQNIEDLQKLMIQSTKRRRSLDE